MTTAQIEIALQWKLAGPFASSYRVPEIAVMEKSVSDKIVC